MALNEADLLFAVRREPVANRIGFHVVHDVFDNWFSFEEISEKSDAGFDREVLEVFSALTAKEVFAQFTVYERSFGWAILALSYAAREKVLKKCGSSLWFGDFFDSGLYEFRDFQLTVVPLFFLQFQLLSNCAQQLFNIDWFDNVRVCFLVNGFYGVLR
jgi:hypothetical protein